MLCLNQENLRVDADVLKAAFVLELKLLVRERLLPSDHSIQEHVQEHRWTLKCSSDIEHTTGIILE